MPERKCKVLLILNIIYFSNIDVGVCLFVFPGRLKMLLNDLGVKKLLSLGNFFPLNTNAISKINIKYQRTCTNLIYVFGLYYVFFKRVEHSFCFKFANIIGKRNPSSLFFLLHYYVEIPYFIIFMSGALKRWVLQNRLDLQGFWGSSCYSILHSCHAQQCHLLSFDRCSHCNYS